MASILKRWVVSTPDNCWREVSCAVEPAGGEVGLQVTSSGEQTWDGFGGCFNEPGARAFRGKGLYNNKFGGCNDYASYEWRQS